jgi:hypothetical protein
MQRSKQQALMLLLGVGLACGVVGFSADRFVSHERFTSQWGPRARFFDDLGLSQTQRTVLDSLAFQQDCAVKAVLAPQDSALKVIRTRFHAQQDSVFTKDQLTRLAAKRKEMDDRHKADRDKEPKRTCSGN